MLTSRASMSPAIDLRSDTLTVPDEQLRRAISRASVGDDCFGEDPTIRELEYRCTELLGCEAAIFMPTGTFSNQVAIRVHTQPGDELITDADYHVNFYESAQTAAMAGVAINAIRTTDGILTPELVDQALGSKPRGCLYAEPKLLCLENTINAHGGRVFPFARLAAVSEHATRAGLAVHLDGARLFNASAASGVPLHEYGRIVDTISVCFAKGLGAPFGSVLAGTSQAINRARRARKWMGGALHQGGFMAAGALHALEHNTAQLHDDHLHARVLAQLLAQDPSLGIDPAQVQTNVVIIDLSATGWAPDAFVAEAQRNGVLMMRWVGTRVRAVTSSNVTEADVRAAADRILDLVAVRAA
ncbi:MAG: GntG family PLP-dependent aldolase [Jatrophihabitantaceae bacterium]